MLTKTNNKRRSALSLSLVLCVSLFALPSTTEVARRFVEEDRWMNTKVCAVVVGAALAAAPVAAPAVALLPLQSYATAAAAAALYSAGEQGRRRRRGLSVKSDAPAVTVCTLEHNLLLH
jgi:hypothetical protein